MNIICWFKEFYRTMIYPGTFWGNSGAMFSGHDLVEDEIHENVTVQIMHCEVCGKQEIGWKQ